MNGTLIANWSAAPCAVDPDAWDLESVDLPGAVRAIGKCASCPLLGECAQRLMTQYKTVGGPNGLIQAGAAHMVSTGARLDRDGLVAYFYPGRRLRRAQHAAAA